MKKEHKLTKKDYIILGIMILLYSVFSFYNLGSFDNPNTFTCGKEINLSLTENRNVSRMRYFTGHEMDTFSVLYTTNGTDYIEIEQIKNKSVFAWFDLAINENVKAIKIILSDKVNIGEVALYDINGKILPLLASDPASKRVIDEQNTVPKTISYMNSTYFDEVYFARTAYEYAHNLPAYEWVHPPLGKLIMALPIHVFKMAPFYYRLMGNIAGILMIPVLYILAKRMFKKTKYATFAALLLCFDGFHFTHTRLGTVDSFLVLFLLLAFLFMYEYFLLKEDVPIRKKQVKLFLSGLCMGLSMAVKWTGCFGAIALAILFFIHFFKNYIRKKEKRKEGGMILLSCVLFFVIVPVVIHVSCYLAFPNMYYFQTDSIGKIGSIMNNMYQYHSSLQADHPFYSSWYTWPFMLKPVWYYVSNVGDLKGTISGFGNPIVWWLGTAGMLYMIYKCIKKEKNAFFIMIIYMCMLIPYIGISRGMYLYHYFPALPFTMLAATYLVKNITEKTRKNYIYTGCLVLVIFFFIYFLPVITGTLVEPEVIEKLKWFSSWIF